ncbi:MAG: Rpn family recombination-promoting nuclease/putative transposase, partial [[Clostridium] innocuum]|nr:Rpn family recombination-promoting nuclease/putative transposase [[Clostridium] innocuum]
MSNAMNQLNYSNDLFFKYTLSREDEGSVYARNTIIERVTGIRVKESTVLNPNLDPGIIGKKRIILDVHVKDEQNRHFNIEMQTTYKGLAEMMRFEFYGARALNDQLNSGKKYKDLKPVYQIIFIDEYAWNNRNLINQYQMRNEQGEKESYYPLILRTYIHMPAINDIVREKEIQRLNDFEQLVYLFENNGKNDILKSKERLV